MRIPDKPPSRDSISREVDPLRFDESDYRRILGATPKSYPHWDDLRFRTPPQGLSRIEWWHVLKSSREGGREYLDFFDKDDLQAFSYVVPNHAQEELHQLDKEMGGLEISAQAVPRTELQNRLQVALLMEEAITSSQLEGAVTTRRVAKDMLTSGRKPRDNSERMILNNYRTMQRIRDLKAERLTPSLVFDLHRLVTDQTLEDPAASGRFRRTDEQISVRDFEEETLHVPPAASELPARLEALCAFANGDTPGFFVHPVVRAIIVHFWLAYDHPFVDGNGRTARALFYWKMLNSGYWLFEFISISSILLKAPVQYGRSFLLTETDDNDLTYFIVAQLDVIRRAIESLQQYILRKVDEQRQTLVRLKSLASFNHRQEALLRDALQHPGQLYTIAGHRTSHNVVYQTARTDLLDLAAKGLLEQHKRGKTMVFLAPADLADRLAALGDSPGLA